MKPLSPLILEFLEQSNYIERERSEQAFEDSKKAWEFAFENKDKFGLEYMLNIHKLLMQNLRPDIAGKLRDCAVCIRRLTHLPMSYLINMPDEEIKKMNIRKINGLYYSEEILRKMPKLTKEKMEARLNKMFNQYNSKKQDFGEDEIMQWHVNFENLHPFRDGNGRTGRILMNIQYINAEIPILVIHEGEEQQEYYKWFKGKCK